MKSPYQRESKDYQNTACDAASQRILHALGSTVDRCINPTLGHSNQQRRSNQQMRSIRLKVGENWPTDGNKKYQLSQKSVATTSANGNENGVKSIEISEPKGSTAIRVSNLIKKVNCFNKNGRRSDTGIFTKSEAKCVKQLTKENKEYVGILY